MSSGGRPCSVCDDSRRPAIEAELASAARKSYPQLADIFRPISSQALRRHHLSHMAGAGVAAGASSAETAAPAQDPNGPGVDLVTMGRQIHAWTLALLEEAAEDGDFRDVAGAVRVALQTHERLMKAFAARPPEFDPLRDATICAVRDRLAAVEFCPECRSKALEALRPPNEEVVPA